MYVYFATYLQLTLWALYFWLSSQKINKQTKNDTDRGERSPNSLTNSYSQEITIAMPNYYLNRVKINIKTKVKLKTQKR